MNMDNQELNFAQATVRRIRNQCYTITAKIDRLLRIIMEYNADLIAFRRELEIAAARAAHSRVEKLERRTLIIEIRQRIRIATRIIESLSSEVTNYRRAERYLRAASPKAINPHSIVLV